jgi:hypothetical protein
MKRVVDLTDQDRRQWCEWFVCALLDGKTLEPQPLTSDGYTTRNACQVTDFSANGVLDQGLSLDECIGNLELSKCQATMSDLDDCVLAFYDPHITSCGPYLATSGCSGTIASVGQSNSTCPKLKVR